MEAHRAASPARRLRGAARAARRGLARVAPRFQAAIPQAPDADGGRTLGRCREERVAPQGPRFQTDVYEPYLNPWRDEPISLFEIGIKRGSSLRMWVEYFTCARFYAMDIRDCSKFVPDSDRIKTFVGDQTDTTLLDRVAASGGPFDLIVDDGSHVAEDLWVSLLHLWPHLKPGGLYIVEDIQTSYGRKVGGDNGEERTYREPGSTVERLKGLVDDIHVGRHKRDVTLEHLASVHFEFRVALLRKRPERD